MALHPTDDSSLVSRMKTRCMLVVLLVIFSVGAVSASPERTDKLRKAAERGEVNAQFNLGITYWFGDGVTKNPVEAVNWYRKAAEQGLAKAQFNLGCAYSSGTGVIKDPFEAVNWYRNAAEQGFANAQYCLGIAYWYGEGAKKEPVEAYAWLNVASAFGCEPARSWRDSLTKDLSKEQSAEATRRARELMATTKNTAERRTPARPPN